MKTKVFSVLLAAVLVVTCLASACGKKDDNYVVQIASGAALCSAPIYIAIEQGFLDEEGISYSYNMSEGNQWDLMAAGKNDYCYGLLPTFVQRIANGFDMQIVMGDHYGCINAVASDKSGIQSIKDLKGKRVGIPTGMGSDPAIMLQRMLVYYGIPIEEVDLQVFTNADLAPALQEDRIDAFIAWDPYASIVAGYEGIHEIYNQANDPATKDEYCCVTGFRTGFVEDHPEIAKKFVAALCKACDWIAAHPEDAARISYEKAYIADPDYKFNGQLLATYRYGGKYQAAKDSFIQCTKDLMDLKIVNVSMTAQQLADSCFTNAGGIK